MLSYSDSVVLLSFESEFESDEDILYKLSIGLIFSI
jgi:hypothetical protein